MRHIADLIVGLFLASIVYGIAVTGVSWHTDFDAVTTIDLSLWALPKYTLLSAIRCSAAYCISLIMTLIVGYAAAKSRSMEKVLLPLLDILQSVPVLGFLPGVLLSFVALFPHSHVGLELTAIVMIVTAQVWNMTLSYYSSLKSVPTDLQEVSSMLGFDWLMRLLKLELPYAAIPLAWNSVLSMAGGWFFLIPCEALTLGDQEYRLPGIGAYMYVAIAQRDFEAMVAGVVAMVLLIVMMDFSIWRPLLVFAHRYRLEDNMLYRDVPLFQVWVKKSIFFRLFQRFWPTMRFQIRAPHIRIPGQFYIVGQFCFLAVMMGVVWGAVQLVTILQHVTFQEWLFLLRGVGATFLRVLCCLLLSTLFAVPLGIWLGVRPERVAIAQPVIQICASFPAPMLYPLMLQVFFWLHMPFFWSSMLLMLMGVGWYVLFNVLAGAMRMPRILGDVLRSTASSRRDVWRYFYLPCIMPELVTGWMTAAGGAWNASVLAEYFMYQGKIVQTDGIGAALSIATASGRMPLFAASLVLMVSVVVIINRLVWTPLYAFVNMRYKRDF